MSVCLSKSEAGDCLINLQATWSVLLKQSKERPQHRFACESTLLSHGASLSLSLLISVGNQQAHHLLLGIDADSWSMIQGLLSFPSTLPVPECHRKGILLVQFHPILHGCSQSPTSFCCWKPHVSCSFPSSTSPLRSQMRARPLLVAKSITSTPSQVP